MKKTTLALAALMALSCGTASAVEKKDYQLNFFAEVNNNFSFERLDGKSWSEAIDIKYSALRNEFEERLVKTRVTLSGHNDTKPLKAALMDGGPRLVNKSDYTQEIGLEVKFNSTSLKSPIQLGTAFQTVATAAKDENLFDLIIKPSNLDASGLKTGDYEGHFKIQFEHEV